MSLVTACMLVGLGSLTTYAADQTNPSVEAPQQLTDQQKADMAQYEAKFKEAQSKFDALTDEQKKEVYDLFDKINVAKVKLLDKYVEFGIISKDEADRMKEHMAEFAENARRDKIFIGVYGQKGPKKPKLNDSVQEKSDKELLQEDKEPSNEKVED